MTIQLYDLVGTDTSRPFSPHCWKSKMMFAHLGLDIEAVPTRFTQIGVGAMADVKSVPTIRDGDLVLVDSFEIARHYAGGTALMGGQEGEPLVRFVESWSQTQLHSWIGGWAMLDIHNLLDDDDQKFFRAKREKLFGKTLEEITANREQSVPVLMQRLAAMKMMLSKQKFIGGDQPSFADYIPFGAFQWLRIVSGLQMIPQDHPVMDWFNRCLDLHDGLGHSVSERIA